MKHWRILTLFALLPLLAMLASCSSDDTTTPDEDTDAPVVVQVDPNQDETDVAVGEDVTIVFNEDMDPATADGNVTLSHGTITDLDWLDDKTLEVAHGDWPEGTEVTVTVGTGLADVAGNALAQAFAWSFWTWTNDVILQNTLPENGATGVPINTQVWLGFSRAMNGATLPGAITVTSPDKATHAYTLDGGHEDWTLTFAANLPASTLITVTITTDAQGEYGDPLAAETSFAFTTGDAADTTPPQLVSIEPTDGSIIPTDTSYLRLTFDEPVDDDSLQPSVVSGQLMLSMNNPDNAGVWSENHTVFTVALAPPLTPGAILAVTFESFADMHGNVNDTPTEWSVTVAGTPNYFPLVDTYVMYYAGSWTNDPIKETGWIRAATKYELKTGGEFWRWTIEEAGPYRKMAQIPFTDYDRMKATSSAIQFLGFHEVNEEPGKEVNDITFNPPIDWLKLPVTAQTWSGTSTFQPVPQEGPTQVSYTIEILPGVFDLEGLSMGKQGDSPTIFWLGCRKAVLEFEVGDGVDVYQEGTETYWYCPGIGPVRKDSMETEGSETYMTTLDLVWAGLEVNFPD